MRLVFCRFFCALYLAPRAALHGLHEGTNSVSSPTRSNGTTWSASVAGRRLHQWHIGFSRSSSARRLRYAAFAVRLGMGVHCGGTTPAPPASALANARLLSLRVVERVGVSGRVRVFHLRVCLSVVALTRARADGPRAPPDR